MNKDIQSLFKFVTLAEKLKCELRHSWTSNKNRQESVAEHTWMMSLMAIIFVPNLEKKVDQLKVIKMAIVHDLGETIIGDIPTFEVSERKKNKTVDEPKAMKKLLKLLPYKEVREEIWSLWEECEKCKTPEARLVKMIDKTEVLVQHNLSDIETWNDGDYSLALYAKDYLSDFDKFTRAYKDELDIWTVSKVKKESSIKKLPKEDLQKFKKKNLSFT